LHRTIKVFVAMLL